MRDRTLGGHDCTGKKFPPYSKEYIKSMEFKIARKSKGNVNLKQTGDMLADIEILKDTDGKLTIGFEKDTLSNDKADGHITGNVGVKRDFLGFEGKEKRTLDAITSEYKAQIEEGNLDVRFMAWVGKRFMEQK